jgi:large subunit ribosomal protein L29
MKNKEIKGLSDQELIEKIRDGKADLNKLTLNHAISPIESPAKIRLERRKIARLKTEVNLRKNGAAKTAGKTTKK